MMFRVKVFVGLTVAILSTCIPRGLVFGADIALAGVFAGKGVLIIDGGSPRTLRVGESTPEGVRLIEVGGNAAVIEFEGRTRRIVMGQSTIRVDGAQSVAAGVSLTADPRGHHFVNGGINGATMRFIVDTGASFVSIGLSDALRAGIDYQRGTYTTAQTASGPAGAWLVRLDTVEVGTITLYGVDAIVFANDLPFVLLGMSFLTRTEIRHEGSRMILRKRY